MAAATYEILHRDATLVVVDKAPGVLTVGAPGSKQRCLLDDLRRDGLAVAPVHRLDKETSGVLLLCLDKAQRAALEQLFRTRSVTKEYLALVHGRPASPVGTLDLPILDKGATAQVDRRGRPAQTRYEVLESLGGVSLVKLQPTTGRHNQIRVHMAYIGHPLVGDRKFGQRPRSRGPRGDDREARRTLLHASRLAFEHPLGGRPLDLTCEPPEDFQAVLAAWR